MPSANAARLFLSTAFGGMMEFIACSPSGLCPSSMMPATFVNGLE
jgi:hypothetical protein